MIRRRKQYRDKFTIIDRRALEDSRLSFEARGLLAYLMCKRDDWTVHLSDISREGGAWKGDGKKLGRDKVYRLLSELVSLGYARRIQPRDDKSQKFCKVDYEVGDDPLTGFPVSG